MKNQQPSICSKIFHLWVLQKAFGGNKIDQNLNDASPPSLYDKLQDYEKFKMIWRAQTQANQTQNKLQKAFQQLFHEDYKCSFLIHFLAIQLNSFSIFLFFYLFQNIIHHQFHTPTNLIIIASIALLKIVRIVLTLWAENKLFLIGERIYSCLNYAIIDVVFSHQEVEENSRNLSKIMHLDTQKILHYAYLRSFTINSCISILINAFLLIYLFSWVGLIGFASFVVSFALFICAIQYGKSLQAGFMEENQKRVHKTIEVFQMIKFIKINVMERFFYLNLCQLREKELEKLKKIFSFDLIMIAMTVVLLKSIILVVCLSTVKNGLEFDSAVLFSLYLIFNNISLHNTAKQIKNLKQCSLSFSNIEQVLKNSSSPNQFVEEIKNCNDSSYALTVNGSFSWKTGILSPQQAELKNISISIKKGDFVSIIGQYASGKSTFIHSILGNLKPIGGAKVQIYGSLAYVGQKSFITNSSIMENIVFGEDFNQNRYKDALRYSCLEDDFKILEDGDKTIIGQRGFNLSGGQKARVCLARALYRNADIYILDDILSSVDANVGAFIFHQTIKQYLKQKTVVLITHSINLLSTTDRVIMMDASRIQYFGQFGKVTSQGLKLGINQKIRQNEGEKKNQKIVLEREEVYLLDKDQSQEIDDFYLYFSRNGGISFVVVITILFLILAASNSFMIIWINQWANSPDTEISLYVFITVISIILTCVCSLAIAKTLHYSEIFLNLHSDAVSSLLQAPFQFYQKTHFAKIVKILANDLKVHDRILVANFYTFLTYASAILSALLVIFGITIYENQTSMLVTSLIFIPIIFYPFFRTLIQSRKLNRERQEKKIRLNSIFDEAMEGKETLRAHEKIDYQFNLFSNQLQQYCKLNLCFNTMGSFTIASAYITYFLFLFCMIVLCYFEGDQATSSYNCALIASVVLGEQKLILFSQGISEFLINLKSLRRCNDLTQIICEDGADHLSLLEEPQFIDYNIHNDSGQVEFENFSIKYRTRSNYALKNLNFRINEGERVCVVGRTGSGKSTLILSLVRAICSKQGSIKIGGKDINKMSLNELRGRMSVILQENFLFQGSIKQNIDHMHQCSDEKIIQILKKCDIWDTIQKRGGLEALVEEKAQNFSAGERQILSIARAMLNPRKIVLIDQATSNIDQFTDLKVQQLLKECFAASTVISISHRLTHVTDFDKILVLNNGEVAEFDSPSVLLCVKDSSLSHLFQVSNSERISVPL